MDGALHLGDGFFDLDGAVEGLFVMKVAGNGDALHDEPPFKSFEIAGKNIVMTHGHLYGARAGNVSGLLRLAKETNADICLYGHTHAPLITRQDGVLIMNPGSVSRPRSAPFPSYGVIEIEPDGAVIPSIINITPDFFL
jgi:putative phosphoesterase